VHASEVLSAVHPPQTIISDVVVDQTVPAIMRAVGALVDDIEDTGFLGLVGLGLPLFATNQPERARARAEVTIALARHEALRTVIPAQIARAHVAVTTAVRRVRAYGTEILPRFEESLTLLTRALELGEIDVVELSVASGRFLAVQREALSATADYHRALADLEAAVGSELEDIEREVQR
jgi:cobalt-zinc-cadmium efflux system outer membrane protein